MIKIILATSSPHRIEAFKFLGIDIEAPGHKLILYFYLLNAPEPFQRHPRRPTIDNAI
jgi:hypothetical protein